MEKLGLSNSPINGGEREYFDKIDDLATRTHGLDAMIGSNAYTPQITLEFVLPPCAYTVCLTWLSL